MELRFQEWVPDFFGLQSMFQSGAQQVQPSDYMYQGPVVDCSHFLAPNPEGFESTSFAVIRNNLAVIPTEWFNSGVGGPWFSIESHDSMLECMTQMEDASFVSFNAEFLDFVGPDAKLEKIHGFSGEDAKHVHEAPVYLETSNELLFADTSVIGWLWALEIDSHKIRKINTSPPLENVNGATLRNSRIYLTTNGGRAPGIWNCSMPQAQPPPTTETISCLPVVNNYYMNHFNSPNDLIFTSAGNILFTDPTYGWMQSWPGLNPPELPTSIYHFNTATRTLTTLDNYQVLQPNGLALSPDEKTLYIADSNSTSGKPIGLWNDSVRNIYAFDFNEEQLLLRNRRLVHVVESGWPDGVRVTTFKGKVLVLIASMGGVDVVDASRGGAGTLLGKWNVGKDIIFNLQHADGRSGMGEGEVWVLTGRQGVYKVTKKLTG